MLADSVHLTVKQSKKSSKLPVEASRNKIVQRLWKAAETQVCEIEHRLKVLGSDTSQFERDARSLGLLAKFLKELVSIECLMDETQTSAKINQKTIEDHDAPPRDLDQFRIELEKRLDAMRKGRDAENISLSG